MLSIRCCCQFSCLCRNRFYSHYSSAWSQQLLSNMLWNFHQIIRVLEESKCYNSLSFSHVVALSSSFLWTCERCTVVFKASFAEILKFTFKTVWCFLECLQCACFSCKIFKKDDTEIDVIDIDFNSFVFDFLTRWFNIMFSNVMITLSRWLSFVERFCFLFRSLSISNLRLINVSVIIFNVIALSSLCFCTTWYRDLCFVTLFILFFSICRLWYWESKTLCIFQHVSHFYMSQVYL